jgi:ubiquinone/menaquinone biosynthesis C-methylase UbiE
MNPNPRTAIFNNLASSWDERMPLTDERAMFLRKWITSLPLQHGDRILDVGCGTGILIPLLLERMDFSHQVVGIDLAPTMIQHAKRKHSDSRVSFVVGDVLTHAFNPATFHHILVFSALPHFPDKVAAFARFHELLYPNGLLSIVHAASSNAINAFHQNLDNPILQKDILPSLSALRDLLPPNTWTIQEQVDMEGLFRLDLQKSG